MLFNVVKNYNNKVQFLWVSNQLFFLFFNINSSLSMAFLMLEGVSLITWSIITRAAKTTCSKATNSSTHARSLLPSPNAARKSLSIERRAQFVMTEKIIVTLKAVYQAPISRTPRGVGFRASLQSLYASIRSSEKLKIDDYFLFKHYFRR